MKSLLILAGFLTPGIVLIVTVYTVYAKPVIDHALTVLPH